jgi:hypothetical protein
MKTSRPFALVVAAGAFALVVAAGAFAVVVPAVAAKPSHAARASHPRKSHKCAPHNEAYTASGQLVSWSATQTGNGRFSGTITIHVTKANHHAAGVKGTDVTYTLTNATAHFGKGADPPTAGDRVNVIGKISALHKKCDQSGFTATVTVRKVDVHGAKS